DPSHRLLGETASRGSASVPARVWRSLVVRGHLAVCRLASPVPYTRPWDSGSLGSASSSCGLRAVSVRSKPHDFRRSLHPLCRGGVVSIATTSRLGWRIPCGQLGVHPLD